MVTIYIPPGKIVSAHSLKSMHGLKLPLQEKALSPRGISGSGGWAARGGRGNGEWIAASA